MNTNEIKIDGKVYKLGCNLHTRLLYERMAGKILGDNMLTLEHIIFFYVKPFCRSFRKLYKVFCLLYPFATLSFWYCFIHLNNFILIIRTTR